MFLEEVSGLVGWLLLILSDIVMPWCSDDTHTLSADVFSWMNAQIKGIVELVVLNPCLCRAFSIGNYNSCYNTVGSAFHWTAGRNFFLQGEQSVNMFLI